MAITFVAAGTSSGSTSTVTPGLPAGVVSGDLLLLHIESSPDDTGADSAPTGGEWTLAATDYTISPPGADDTKHTVYYHWYTGTDPNRTVPDTGDHTLAVITAWRGVDSSTGPFDATVVSATDITADFTLGTAGIATNTDGAMVVTSGTTGDNNTFSGHTWPAALSSTGTASESNTLAGSDGTIGVWYGICATATDFSGAGNGFFCTIDGTEKGVYFTIALKPAVASASDITHWNVVALADISALNQVTAANISAINEITY